MNTYAITYVYSSDAAQLDEHRPAHRAYLQALAVTGSIKASGPVSQEGLSGALIIVKASSVEDALALLEHDPFWQKGLIVDRAAVQWNIVIGPWSQN